MIWTIVFTIVIVLYVLWVIYRKIQRIKDGKYCSCGCESCGKECKDRKED